MQILQEKERLACPDVQGKEELAKVVEWETEYTVDEGFVNESLTGDSQVGQVEEDGTGRSWPRQGARQECRDSAPHHDRNHENVCEDRETPATEVRPEPPRSASADSQQRAQNQKRPSADRKGEMKAGCVPDMPEQKGQKPDVERSFAKEQNVPKSAEGQAGDEASTYHVAIRPPDGAEDHESN
jgi:hypothetical protein